LKTKIASVSLLVNVETVLDSCTVVLVAWLLGGRLSVIYACSTADMWPHYGWSIRYGSANQANSALHPFGVCKWVEIHIITWIMKVETIKRQTWAAYGCLATRSKVPCRLHAHSVCDAKRRCSCSLCRYI